MEKLMNESSDLTTRTKINTVQLGLWTGAWVLTTAFAAFGPKFFWEFNTPLTIHGVLINLGIGFGMILANNRYLKGLDELMRKIQLEAMAISLGVGLVCGLSYELLEDIKLITFEPEVSHLIMLMALTYMVGVIAGNRRYK
ncbi:MAG: hypothetical protein QF616_02330 [Candidatus Marinimicrobia bacterium]|nr:hypothetical protein [Candidatus Neomarinimicrobiota bacterium]